MIGAKRFILQPRKPSAAGRIVRDAPQAVCGAKAVIRHVNSLSSIGLVCTPDGEGRAGVLQPWCAQLPTIAARRAAGVGGAGDYPAPHHIPSVVEVI